MSIVDSLLDLVRAEPVRVASIIVSVVVAGASALGIVVDEQSVLQIVAYVLPILVGGEVARAQVSPVK